jgi:DNA processing protein
MPEALYYNTVALALEGDYKKIAKLKQYFGTWENVYRALGRFGVPAPNPERAWDDLARADTHLVILGDERYPPLLREISRRPFGIYIKGSLTKDTEMPIAIVGTRRATAEGKDIARRFGRELANCGFTIISGLAFGIDAAAHEGCLDAGRRTVAVLAGGLHDIYPQTNDRLARKIIENGGAIISEYPLGAPPYGYRFLERNRIISGLSRGVLVVEAPEGSGALVTAREAREENRDVFVAPGSIVHSNFEGSHALIRQGAELVTCPEEILEAYNITHKDEMAEKEKSASTEERLILKALREIKTPAHVDKIIETTKLEPRIVNQAIGFLLVKNFIRETGQGYTI